MSSPALRADCSHLDPARRPGARAATRGLAWVLALTATFMVVEFAGGWLSGSLALLADAGHMLTDVGALALSVGTAWLARRPADDTKTYGYLRWEILAAFVNGAALLVLSVWVVAEAIGRLRAPAPVDSTIFTVVAAAGLVVNLIAVRVLHGDHAHSLNARAAYLHVLSDLLGSVGALGAALVVAFTGWTYADPIVSIVLAVLILVGAWRLVRESVDVLLEAVPRHVSMPEVERRMRAVPGVEAVHDLHVWTVTSGMVAMSGHAVVPELARHPEVLERIRAGMRELGIGHVTIQLERGGPCDDGAPVPATGHGCGHDHGPGAGHHHHAH